MNQSIQEYRVNIPYPAINGEVGHGCLWPFVYYSINVGWPGQTGNQSLSYVLPISTPQFSQKNLGLCNYHLPLPMSEIRSTSTECFMLMSHSTMDNLIWATKIAVLHT